MRPTTLTTIHQAATHVYDEKWTSAVIGGIGIAYWLLFIHILTILQHLVTVVAFSVLMSK